MKNLWKSTQPVSLTNNKFKKVVLPQKAMHLLKGGDDDIIIQDVVEG